MEETKPKSIQLWVAALMTVLLMSAVAVQPARAQNTFYGTGAGISITTGTYDSGFGYWALHFDDTGSYNTATGYAALQNNISGGFNTATGTSALHFSTADSNTATGYDALNFDTAGGSNTATGGWSLFRNTTGGFNTAVGLNALNFNTSGNYNIAVGFQAGTNLTTGNNNIDIGNAGISGESNTIRIGTKGVQKRTFIAGIYNTAIYYGSPVMVNGRGRLGIMPSSVRFKRDIHDLGDAGSGLMRLRPVTFRYKEDLASRLQYGLIAEEVEQVYPALVIRGADGRVQGVRYDMLPALLLGEMQKMEKKVQKLENENQRKDAQIAILQKEQARIDKLTTRLTALEEQARTQSPGSLADATR